MNTASDAQSHLLNKNADTNSTSGLLSDLGVNGWVQHKILMPGSCVLEAPLSTHRVRGIGDRRLTLNFSSSTAIGLVCEGILHE